MARNPFTALRRRFNGAAQKIPREIGRVAENHFKEGFTKGGGQTDAGKWQQVKRREPGTYAYKYAKSSSRSRGILIGSGSGRLKRSITVTKATFKQVRLATVGNEVNRYAKVHNEGLRSGGSATGGASGSGFKMTRREFMGPSKELDRKVKQAIIKGLSGVFR